MASPMYRTSGADSTNALPVFELNGDAIRTLEGLYDEVSRVLVPGANWGRNLDAFHDVLRGGFGTPEGGFLLVWRNHLVSREALGYPETARLLKRKLDRSTPRNRADVARDLELARAGAGPTIFDGVIEIISQHGPEGTESASGVRLELR